MTPEETARQAALRYVDFAPRTAAQVRRRLLRDGHDDTVIDGVLEFLARAGLVDDERFSRDWVESRGTRKGLGRARLGAELRGKGVPRDTAEEALASLSPADELAAAAEAARKRLGSDSLSDPVVRRRLAGFLRRRGYDWETVARVMALLREEPA